MFKRETEAVREEKLPNDADEGDEEMEHVALGDRFSLRQQAISRLPRSLRVSTSSTFDDDGDGDEDEEEEEDEHAQLSADVQELEDILRASHTAPILPPLSNPSSSPSSSSPPSQSRSSSTLLPRTHTNVFEGIPVPSFTPHSALAEHIPVPSSLSALRAALAANLSYQQMLAEALSGITARLTALAERERLVVAIYQHSSLASAPSIALSPYQSLPRSALFSFPWLIAASSSPSSPPDVLLRTHPVRHRAVAWNENERQALELGIQHTNQLAAIRSAVSALPPSSSSSAATAAIASVKARPASEFLLDYNAVDWGMLSASYVPSRTASDLRLEWTNRLDPRINHGPWTASEDDFLVQAAAASSHWVEIAAQMGTSRTAFDCFCRYVRSLAADVIRSAPWTREEDEALRRVVEEEEGSRDWKRVSERMAGRTEQQVMHRYMKALKGKASGRPSEGRGPWRVDEDLRLRLAVMACDARWTDVAKGVGGCRSDVSCRERYMNALRPGVNKTGGWSAEEIAQLLRAVEEEGERWRAVGARMPGRTEKQCMKKWKRLTASSRKRQAADDKKDASDDVDAADAQPPASQQRWLYTGFRRRQGNEVTVEQGRGRKRQGVLPAPKPARAPTKRRKKDKTQADAEGSAESATDQTAGDATNG